MFTGIIRAVGRIADIQRSQGVLKLTVKASNGFFADLYKGASVAVDGVCLTAISSDATTASFDVIGETLKRATLDSMKVGQSVNLERAARLGDEIGGHLLSGHIFATVTIKCIEKDGNNCSVIFDCPIELMKYLFPKGYVALNGASLTLVDVNAQNSTFSVHLIPETLENTTFGTLTVGNHVNLEVDAQTQAVVDTIERVYASKSTS